MLKKLLLFIFVISCVNFGFGQQRKLSQNAKVSVLTCGLGNESYSLFGHTAIRIKDDINNLDLVYNYGAFDFATPNFIMKFTKGDLQYFIVANSYQDFIYNYNYEQRSVFEQELEISNELKQQLFERLNASLLSAERYYTYKFIDKNCTSMVVDILNSTLGNNIIKKNVDTDITYRTVLYPYFENQFYYKLGISIIFGTKVDEKATKIFLPFELLESLITTKFNNKPLCSEVKTLISFDNQVPFCWYNNVYYYLIVLALILILNKKSINMFFLSLLGMMGVFFFVVGFYSLHKELAYNYNMLLFNPSLLILVYFLLRKNKKWIFNLATFNFLSVLFYLIFILNKAHLLLVMPISIVSLVILGKEIFRNRGKEIV